MYIHFSTRMYVLSSSTILTHNITYLKEHEIHTKLFIKFKYIFPLQLHEIKMEPFVIQKVFTPGYNNNILPQDMNPFHRITGK